MTPKLRLLDMPQEVLQMVAAKCDVRSLGSLRRTCKECSGLRDSRLRDADHLQRLAEAVYNMRNALFAEMHSLPRSGKGKLTKQEVASIYAKGSQINVPYSRYIRNLDRVFGCFKVFSLFVYGHQLRVRLYRHSKLFFSRGPSQMINVDIAIDQTRINYADGTFAASLADGTFGASVPLSQYQGWSLPVGTPQSVRDLADIIHGCMLHYFGNNIV